MNTDRYPITWDDIVTPYESCSDGFEEAKAQGISLAMAYGVPNNGDTSVSGYYATAALIWAIHKRSTAAKGGFKGNAPSSQPEYSFHWTGADDTVFLFEAPIDMLSFITLHKPGWKNHSYAAACSVSDKVLWQMLQDQPWLKQVYLCLDSDEAGQSAAKRIAEKLEKHSMKYEILVPKHKDWNEDLLHLRKEEAQWMASRP